MSNVDLRATLVGFAGALAVLSLLLLFVGIGRIGEALSRANLRIIPLIFLVALGWLTAWGLSLRTVLDILEVRMSVFVSVLVFAVTTFANNVTPFGQAGGEPVSALFIAKAADTEYETGLAAIASVDSLNFIPSISLAAIGLGYFSFTIAFGRRLQFAAVTIGVLALMIPFLGYLGWRYRYTVEQSIVRVLRPLSQTVGQLLPRRNPPDADAIASHIEGFFHALERIASNKRGLVLALGFSTVGWLFQAGALWLSLYALGIRVSFAAMLIVIPVGAIAGLTPLPGGLGGIEAVLIGLLISPAVGVSQGVAGAAVIIHRSAIYWLPIILGGGTAAVLGDQSTGVV